MTERQYYLKYYVAHESPMVSIYVNWHTKISTDIKMEFVDSLVDIGFVGIGILYEAPANILNSAEVKSLLDQYEKYDFIAEVRVAYNTHDIVSLYPGILDAVVRGYKHKPLFIDQNNDYGIFYFDFPKTINLLLQFDLQNYGFKYHKDDCMFRVSISTEHEVKKLKLSNLFDKIFDVSTVTLSKSVFDKLSWKI